MSDFPGISEAVTETVSHLVKGEALHAVFSRDPGGSYSILVCCEKSVVRDLCITAVTLYGIYSAHNLMARALDGIVSRWLGGPRKDQDIGDIKPGSLHVKLHCLTDKRFLEVWNDFESGRMKARLQEEFTQAGIDVVGLKVEIENLEEVNDTKRTIESCLKSMVLKEEGDIESNADKMEKLVKGMSRKLDEVLVNQERVESDIKTSFRNLERQIIDEMGGSTTTKKSNAEVIVIGGSDKADTPMASVGKIQLGNDDAAWSPLPSVNVPRSLAASVVIDRKVIVVGGGTDTIETLDVDQRPFKWTISKAVLPFPLFGHSCVVYEGKLIVIGGYNGSAGTYSDGIYEVQLVSPYSSKLLCTLPTPIGHHGTEKINEKVYIFGGKRNGQLWDNILLFDPVTNKCKEIAKLPYPLRYMSTVHWQDKVVLLGGERGDDIALKEVIMFDPMSGKCSKLPPMNHARRGAAAIFSGDVIVVMGGYGSKRPTRSVECFHLGSKTWDELPSMKEARAHVTAVCI